MFRRLFHFTGLLITLITFCGLLARFISPAILWPPAVIALLLPGMIVLTAVYNGILQYRREWRKTILPTLAILVSLPLLPQLFAFGGPTSASSAGQTFRVLTANVRNFRGDDGHSWGPEGGLKFVRGHNPDVLLIQEGWRSPSVTDSYVNEVKDATGLARRHQLGNSPLVTFGKELSFVSEKMLPSMVNGVLVSDVETALGTVRIINAHLQSNQISVLADQIGHDQDVKQEAGRAKAMFRSYGAAAATRARQAAFIRQQIEASPHPVIVGGDFNDVPSSYAYRQVLTPRLRDAWVEAGVGLGTTFTGPLPGLRIDFLLVDTAFSVRSVERLQTGYSDHLGLVVEVE